MKIIGTTEKGYILSATFDEMAQIAGWRCHSGIIGDSTRTVLDTSDAYNRRFKIGTVFEISDAWKKFQQFLAELPTRKRVVEQLTGLIEVLKVPEPLLDEPVATPKPPSLLEVD
jgi:hypothetical protein